MRTDHFLHCRDCEAVFRPSTWDRAPEYRMTDAHVTETPRDDCMDFLARHARHQLETLRPTATGAMYTGALWDTTAPTFWEVTAGDRTVVVEGRRTELGAPLRYRLRTGRLVVECSAVEVPDEDLRRQIDEALFPGVAPDRKIAGLVESFKQIVWSLDPEQFEILYDVPGDPTLSVAKLPATAMTALISAARRLFDESDCKKIGARFGGADEDPDGLTVLIRRRVRVEG